MRQGQQNRRGRGRGGRKPQNPLARNYESNGPDVKIRGTAAHIAEKYMSLARDALASGDMVMAESYFQHAEHYNRIIMAAQQQFPQHGGQPGEGTNGYRPRWNGEGEGDDDDMGESGEPRAGAPSEGVSQDRERHAGDREHHPNRGRHGGNGREAHRDGNRDGNGSDQSEGLASDESASDPVG